MGRKSKELSEDWKQLVVDLKREGHRNCEIVKLLHIPESTIRSIWKKYNSTGNVENIPRVLFVDLSDHHFLTNNTSKYFVVV
jgi:DNA invertase Pin-like site-specific DNA recombinase